MTFAERLLDRLAARAGKKQVPNALVQMLLLRLMRRNPIGLIGTLLLRKALSADGKVFGMDLASRRQARLAWLAGLLQRRAVKHGLSR
jgi:hypothetical protein